MYSRIMKSLSQLLFHKTSVIVATLVLIWMVTVEILFSVHERSNAYTGQSLSQQASVPTSHVGVYVAKGPESADESSIIQKPPITTPAPPTARVYQNLSEALYHSRSPHTNVVVMVVVSQNMLGLTMNFYETTVVRRGIKNVLFLSSNRKTCDELAKRGGSEAIHCFVYVSEEEEVDVEGSCFGRPEFVKRGNMKQVNALTALKEGYTVLMSDVDVVFLKNPLPYLERLQASSPYDIAAQMDATSTFNSGFNFIRPTAKSIQVFTRLIEICKRTGKMDQDCFNDAIKEVRQQDTAQAKLTMVELSRHVFPNGAQFFPGQRCPSEAACKAAIVVHGNGIKCMEEKVLRFKDCMLWFDDGNGYYSDPSHKYIAYRGYVNSSLTRMALLNLFAIGKITSRTVILPKFRKEWKESKVGKSWWILKALHFGTSFDNATSMDYRESTFLANPLVPASVNSSFTEFYSVRNVSKGQVSPPGATVLTPKDPYGGPHPGEFREWFSHLDESVLELAPILYYQPNIYYKVLLGETLYELFVNDELDDAEQEESADQS